MKNNKSNGSKHNIIADNINLLSSVLERRQQTVTEYKMKRAMIYGGCSQWAERRLRQKPRVHVTFRKVVRYFRPNSNFWSLFLLLLCQSINICLTLAQHHTNGTSMWIKLGTEPHAVDINHQIKPQFLPTGYELTVVSPSPRIMRGFDDC